MTHDKLACRRQETILTARITRPWPHVHHATGTAHWQRKEAMTKGQPVGVGMGGQAGRWERRSHQRLEKTDATHNARQGKAGDLIGMDDVARNGQRGNI